MGKKALALAEKIAMGDLSLEAIVKVIDEAIAYGRNQERSAIIRRIRAGYSAGDFSGELASHEILNSVIDRIKPNRHTG
jgi:hypothetical protein